MRPEVVEGDAGDAVSKMRTERPADFAVLATVVPGACFMDPRIQARIGNRGQQAIPVPLDSPDAEESALIASVASRGAIYRPTPT